MSDTEVRGGGREATAEAGARVPEEAGSTVTALTSAKVATFAKAEEEEDETGMFTAIEIGGGGDAGVEGEERAERAGEEEKEEAEDNAETEATEEEDAG